MEQKEESEENKTIRNWLSNITSWFGKKKEIERIRVVTSKQTFWVSNPKKMKWWKGFVERQSASMLMNKNNTALPARITKVVYK